MPSPSIVEGGERKARLSTEASGQPARRTSTGSFISSVRAATSSISDKESERDEREDKSCQDGDASKIVPSSAVVEHGEPRGQSAEEQDKSADHTSDVNRTSPTKSAPLSDKLSGLGEGEVEPNQPQKASTPLLVEHGEHKNPSAERQHTTSPSTSEGSSSTSSTESTPSSNHSSDRDGKANVESNSGRQSSPEQIQEFFTPEPQAYDANEAPDPAALPAEPENDQVSDARMSEKVDDLSFMTGLKEAFLRRTGAPGPVTTTEAQNKKKRAEHLRRTSTCKREDADVEEATTLPEQKHADYLVSEYFKREHVNLPILDIVSFQRNYRSLFSGEDALEDDIDSFGAILNIVFALISVTLHPDKRDDAEIYLIRAKKLIPFADPVAENISSVQAHILASKYFLAIDDLSAAWQSIGTAVRVAQSLYLHVGSGGQHSTSQLDQELPRRVWYGCVIMERIIAMNMGLSTQTTWKAFQTPLPTSYDEDHIDSIFGLNDDLPPITDFFAALVGLYQRYRDIDAVEIAYGCHTGRHPNEVLRNFDGRAIIEADRRLCAWKATLPLHVSPDTFDHASLREPIARRLHDAVRIRYSYMRLLLWRPCLYLASACSGFTKQVLCGNRTQLDSPDDPMSHTIVREGKAKCVRAAYEIASELSTVTAQEKVSPCPWWENVGFAFTCATVFLAARLCPLSRHRSNDAASVSDYSFVVKGWEMSVGFLEDCETFSPVAAKCLWALDLLSLSELGVNGEDAPSMPSEGRDTGWLNCLPMDIPDPALSR